MVAILQQNQQLTTALLSRSSGGASSPVPDETDEGSRRLRQFGAVRQLHAGLVRDPERVLLDFDRTIMAELGVPLGGAWTYRDWIRRIGFGHMRGMARVHAYVGDVLTALKADRPEEATVLCVQLLKAIHQVHLDQGDWRTAVLYLPTADLYGRRDFGGSEREAEAIASYRRSLAELRRMEQQLGTSAEGPTEDPVTGAPKAKGKPNAKGKPKDKAKKAAETTTG